MKDKHVYGPVPSRRFGLSLGVDLVPYKTCSLDCIYCQLGRTTDHTVKRRDYFPPDRILFDVEQALKSEPKPDVITLGGSGEPTLYRSLEELIRGIRNLTDIPIMLLTNGTLLFNDTVARAAMAVDVLSPSLDAGDPETFEAINRPEPSLSFETALKGLREVLEHHPGTIHLEVMMVQGVNDTSEQITQMADLLNTIKAHTIDINSPVRPPACPHSLICNENTLKKAMSAFGPRAKIIATYKKKNGHQPEKPADRQIILDLLARRPCTIEDIHKSLGFHPHEISKTLELAMSNNQITTQVVEGKTYYMIVAK